MLLYQKQNYRQQHYWLTFLSLISSVVSFQPTLTFPSPSLPSTCNAGCAYDRTENESRQNHARSLSLLCVTTKENIDSLGDTSSMTSPTKVYFNLAVNSTPLGRLTFLLTPPSHPHHLVLHTANFASLASSE